MKTKKKRNARAPPSLSNVDDQSPAITKEVEDAMKEHQNGNYTKALKLVEATLSRHPRSALALAALSFCHLKFVFLAKHSTTPVLSKDGLIQLAETFNHVTEAVDLSKRAVHLCPNSLACWFFHANALYKLTEYDANAGYEPVIEACDAGLAIEFGPEDLATDPRIEEFRAYLRLFKLQSKYLIDTKYLENLKNEIQELQERKEEIEERAITASMNFETPELMPLPENKRKIKNLKKVAVLDVDTVETRVKTYWNDTMTTEKKKELLRIRIGDLKDHFAKNKLATEVINQAVEYATGAKNWEFSCDAECFWCGERFFDAELTADHMNSVHLGTFTDELDSVLPEFLFDSVWDTVESGKWKPVNVVEAKKMLEDLSRNEGGNKDFVKQKWPYCNDRRREEIINKIRAVLRLFVSIKCFCSSHFSGLMNLILEMLKKQVPEQLLMEYGINKTLLSVCFLDISELNLVFEFLGNLANICGLQRLVLSLGTEQAIGEHSVANNEKIVFNEDFSCVVFDKRMLRGELMVPNDGAAVTSSADDEIELNDDEYTDAILDWLLKGGTNIGEQLKQWTNLREASRSQGKELSKIYEAEFHRMLNICEKKVQYLRDIKVWQNLESICVEEDKRGEEFGYEPLSYKYLLSNQRQIASTNGDIFELDILWNILREDHVDNEIKLWIKKQIDEMVAKLYKLDAIISTTTINMQQTGKKLIALTGYDYRSILVPLLKSVMRAKLEDLANEDAEKKYDAVKDAFLSELDRLDKKKKTDKGGGNARQGQGNSQEKNKKKDKRKSKK
ncbi:hypothetical protein CMV_007147 [Castanea mollissima]|uniref:C2H2-type domain-containing protein n=1 Tax=Castanea mollissima TaxID=60419 RepID=A0A8J4RMJ1_9ROSI|nr:hypothetical protein CMV_007147 [Castanea mollissima]